MTLLRSARALVAALALIGGMARQASGQQSGDALDRALRDELARSMHDLRLEQLERPYYIAYRVQDIRTLAAAARMGSLVDHRERRARTLNVELRVGDYQLDNSNFMTMPDFGLMEDGHHFLSMGELPLDDDYLALRREIWLATDAEYKEALETIAAKRAARLNQSVRDSLPDFERVPATQVVEKGSLVPPAQAAIDSLARELSRVRELVGLQASEVTVACNAFRIRYINSEGTSTVASRQMVVVRVDGEAQANDGTPLSRSFTLYEPAFAALPGRDSLVLLVRALARQVDLERSAPTIARYNGPVLFEGRAAAALFAGTFAPALIAHRKVAAGSPRLDEMMGAMDRRGDGGSFAERIGARVLPEFLTVVDDPTRRTLDGQPLLGGYTVDDEGVRAHETRLIEDGYLKTLLTTRTPVDGIEHSTGNRRAFGAASSNLLVRASRGVSDVELKQQLVALVKRRHLPFGVLIRELPDDTFRSRLASLMEEGGLTNMSISMSGDMPGEHNNLAAYQIYDDGREELVRGGRLSNLTLDSFKDIVAATNTATVYHRPTGLDVASLFEMMRSGGEPSTAMSSYAVPSLLFEDVTLTRQMVQGSTLPLSDPPPMSP